MGPCPRPPTPAPPSASPAAPAAPAPPAPAPPAPVGARLIAVISSPAGLVRAAADAATTPVRLESAGTTAAILRPIASYSWTVRSRPADAVIATFSGPTAALDLPAGSYTAGLVVRDSLGFESKAQRPFVIGTSVTTVAVIASPADIELAQAAAAADGAAAARVALSAEGSVAAPGAFLESVEWQLQRLPGLEVVGTPNGLTAYVLLPVVSGGV
jgi:hypothetical protein